MNIVAKLLIAIVAVTIPAAALVGGPFSGNNNIANSQLTLAAPGVTWTGSNVGANLEAGEPTPCGLLGSTVWFHFVGTGLPVTIDAVGSNYDTTLAAYRGTLGQQTPAGLTTVVCNDDAIGLISRISFPTTPGQVYFVQGGGFFGFQGSLVVNFR